MNDQNEHMRDCVIDPSELKGPQDIPVRLHCAVPTTVVQSIL